jgi:hypothetical protein
VYGCSVFNIESSSEPKRPEGHTFFTTPHITNKYDWKPFQSCFNQFSSCLFLGKTIWKLEKTSNFYRLFALHFQPNRSSG